MFTFAISCLNTSNLPCKIHGSDIPGSYAILLFTALDLASITSHIHNWVLLLLWLHPFFLSGVVSPLISSSLLGTYQHEEFLFQYPVILSFQTVHGVLKARWPPSWPPVLGGDTWPGLFPLNYTRLWSMWSDWLVVHDFGFSASALWCPHATPSILLGFLLPWTWGISSWVPQQSAASAPYLGLRISPHSHPSWPWPWSNSSQPSSVHAATTIWT